MTKIEYGKCEKLMEEAIRKVNISNEEYGEANAWLNARNRIAYELEHRKADQHYGEAVGINQALAMLGFKHARIKELENYCKCIIKGGLIL